MDRAVQIAGTTYESVPSVTIPTTGGGEASFVEISDTTAVAADVADGKFFYTAEGIKTQGTASGGGTVVVYKDTDGYIVIGSEDCGVDGLVSKDSEGYIVIPEELIAEIKLQGKTVTPTEEYQAIYPDSGYDGLEYVGVNPIPSAYADVTDTTAIATDVAAGKIFYTSEGVRTSGTASGGGGDDVWSGMVDRTISQAIDSMGSISTIGRYAFANCFSLSQLSFPNATIIESNAFQYCSNFSSVYFPNASIISDYAFVGCQKLQSADFPEVERIGTGAFSVCTYLKTVNAPKVSYIGNSAFYQCRALSIISFPDATYVGSAAFVSCKISEANFPLAPSVMALTFQLCGSLLTANFEQASVIGANAFADCVKLENVSFPNASVISASAFLDCNILSKVVFPKVISVYTNAFRADYKLSTVILGYSTTASSGALAGSPFSHNYELLSLYMLMPFLCVLKSSSAFYYSPISTYTDYTSGVHGSIFVPESLYNSYITATNWSYFSSRFVSLTDAQVQHVIDYGTHETE